MPECAGPPGAAPAANHSVGPGVTTDARAGPSSAGALSTGRLGGAVAVGGAAAAAPGAHIRVSLAMAASVSRRLAASGSRASRSRDRQRSMIASRSGGASVPVIRRGASVRARRR